MRGPREPRPAPGAGSRGLLPLPPATVEAIGAAGGAGRCSNLSLALNRFVDAWAPGFARIDERRRPEFLRACAGIAAQPAAREWLQDCRRRHEQMLDVYDQGAWRCLRLRARLRSRFVSGLGIANPLEVNLLLDRLGGFPYLPGSGIKGLTRTMAEELEGEDAGVVRAAFGPREATAAAAAAGHLVFFDALPIGDFSLGLEIMTPHHSDYYAGDEPPADWQSPVPITFLTVQPGAEFRFAVAARAGGARDGGDLLGRAETWLHAALDLGAGAKTSSGYGRFEVLP